MAMSERIIHYFFDMVNLNFQDTMGLKIAELGNQLIGGHGQAERLRSFIPTAKIFFECLGFDHTSIDINGLDGALPLDLNKPIIDTYLTGQFDIVTNIGTSEHVSNQEMCFENMDRLCKDGGIIINVSPFGPDWADHAEYWYSHGSFKAIRDRYDYYYLDFPILINQRKRNGRWHQMICVTFVKVT
jgi:hypothetical protein